MTTEPLPKPANNTPEPYKEWAQALVQMLEIRLNELSSRLDATTTAADSAAPFISVMDHGAVGDGVTDDTNAIQNAIFAAGTPYGGLVIMPQPPVAYLVSGTIFTSFETGSKHVSLLGLGQVRIICTPNLATNYQQYMAQYGVIAIGTVNNLAYPALFVENITVEFQGTQNIGNGPPIAAFTVTGNKNQFRNCKSVGAPVHGFAMRSFVTNNWLENCALINCMAHSSAQYSFAVILEDSITNVFITECGMEYCTSRSPGVGALLVHQKNTQGGNYKISNFLVRKCELDGAGGSSNNVVDIKQEASNGQNIIENLVFKDSTIEDIGNTHSGYALGFGGAGSGHIDVSVHHCIYYGVAGGALPTGVSKPANVFYGPIDFLADGNVETNFLLPRIASSNIGTGSIANTGTATLFTAVAGAVYKVVVADTAGTNVNGEWTVLGTTQIKAGFTATGCTLTYSGSNVVLTNTSGGAITFIGAFQILR